MLASRSLRHRLHHRFTDDPVHDPYCATKGLLWSHVGWIFFKPIYEKMHLIEKDDLESDPVVRFQHKYYIPIALITGFVLPTAVGSLWGDAIGAFIWGGLLTKLLIWHCTFLVNSLAHWDGLQPYSDENTSKGNLILGMLTCGEGNHNFHHSFPHDYRSGPSRLDWDPSKWVIFALYRLGLASNLRRARQGDIADALTYMRGKDHHHHLDRHALSDTELSGSGSSSEDDKDSLEQWGEKELDEYVRAKVGRCVVVVNAYVVDVTAYQKEHPGGAALLRKYAYRPGGAKESTPSMEGSTRTEAESPKWQEASWAFDGGMNQHSRAAGAQMRELTVAKFAN